MKAWGGCRAAWGRAEGGGATDVLSRYTWDWLYKCNDVSGLNWSEADGGTTLVATNAATTGLSTSAWSNLPADTVDEGVSPGTGGYEANVDCGTSNEVHFRLILDPNSPTNGAYMFRYVVTGTRYFFVRIVGGNYIIEFRNGGDIYSRTISSPPTTASLIDIVTSGSQMNVYINGSDVSPTAHTGSVPGWSNGADSLTLMALTVSSSPFAATWVAVGCRIDQTISLADHQTDSAELGL